MRRKKKQNKDWKIGTIPRRNPLLKEDREFCGGFFVCGYLQNYVIIKLFVRIFCFYKIILVIFK